MTITKEFENEIIDIRRVSKVTKGGRNLKFRVTIVVGDREGRVGVGVGSTTEIPGAIQQAIRDAEKSMITIGLNGATISHAVIGKFKAGRVLLKPAYPGTGIIAAVTVGAVCRLAGIQDLLTKCLGTTNPLTLARAVIDGLLQLRSRREVEELRGVPAVVSTEVQDEN